MTVQDDFVREHGQGDDDDDEAGRSPVVSDDDDAAGASSGDDERSGGARGGQGAGPGSDDQGDRTAKRGAKLPPAPGFSAPDDVELLVRTSGGARFCCPRW